VGREVPFVLALPAGAPRVCLDGRLDLLARRGRVHVVRDYKYARPAAASVENYAPQLSAYQLAVRAAGAATVEAELVFLRSGPVVRRLPPLDVRREEAALVDAGVALGQALAAGAIDAFSRRPEAPAACERLGCGYVQRCWGLVSLTRRASSRPSGSAASWRPGRRRRRRRRASPGGRRGCSARSGRSPGRGARRSGAARRAP